MQDKMRAIENAMNWQAGKPDTRHADIKALPNGFSIYCYDQELVAGQYATNCEVIDLKAIATERKRAEYDRLKAEFEGAENAK